MTDTLQIVGVSIYVTMSRMPDLQADAVLYDVIAEEKMPGIWRFSGEPKNLLLWFSSYTGSQSAADELLSRCSLTDDGSVYYGPTWEKSK